MAITSLNPVVFIDLWGLDAAKEAKIL